MAPRVLGRERGVYLKYTWCMQYTSGPLSLCPSVPWLQFPTACSTSIILVYCTVLVYCKTGSREHVGLELFGGSWFATRKAWVQSCHSIMHLLTGVCNISNLQPFSPTSQELLLLFDLIACATAWIGGYTLEEEETSCLIQKMAGLMFKSAWTCLGGYSSSLQGETPGPSCVQTK